MNIEHQVRKALLEAAGAKLVADGIGGIARILMAAGRWADDLADAPFYLELDAARRYRLLTGEELASGINEPDRHNMQPKDMEIPVDEDE